MVVGLESGGTEDVLLCTAHEDTEHEVTRHPAGVWLFFLCVRGRFSLALFIKQHIRVLLFLLGVYDGEEGRGCAGCI